MLLRNARVDAPLRERAESDLAAAASARSFGSSLL
jgi:hypothetical protein